MKGAGALSFQVDEEEQGEYRSEKGRKMERRPEASLGRPLAEVPDPGGEEVWVEKQVVPPPPPQRNPISRPDAVTAATPARPSGRKGAADFM